MRKQVDPADLVYLEGEGDSLYELVSDFLIVKGQPTKIWVRNRKTHKQYLVLEDALRYVPGMVYTRACPTFECDTSRMPTRQLGAAESGKLVAA